MTPAGRSRVELLLERMGAGSGRALWVEPSVNLRWLTGLTPPALERPGGLLVRADGDRRALVPRLDLSEWDLPDIEYVPWRDGEEPAEALRAVLEGVRVLHVQPSLPAWHLRLLAAARPSMKIEVGPDWIAAARRRKDASELDCLREAATAADEAIAAVAEMALTGLTELEVREALRSEYRRRGQEPSPHTLVAAGINSGKPHHSGSDATIEPRSTVIVDTGAVVHGYLSDTTRVLAVDGAPQEVGEAYDLMLAAYEAAVAAATPGASGRDVDDAGREVIEAAGLGECMLHRIGHGLGLEVHEAPYLAPNSEDPVEEGAVLCIEPAVYVEGRFGVRFENSVHIGPEGAEPLNELVARPPAKGRPS